MKVTNKIKSILADNGIMLSDVSRKLNVNKTSYQKNSKDETGNAINLLNIAEYSWIG